MRQAETIQQPCNNNSETALRMKDISKIYPGTVALKGVNLEVSRGEVHGIIGKNGAGKSTLVGIIAGIVTPTKGDIYIGNTRYKHLSRMISKKEKIAIVPQEPQVIKDFTVAENLFLSDYVCRGRFINWKDLFNRAEQVVKTANLNINVRARAGDLSVSEQQLLLVLKACYVEKARIIILDEASASLSQDDEKLLYDIIQERKRNGNTILFISHRTDELLRICDRLTVIRDGRSISTCNCSKLDREKLSALIIGEDGVERLDGQVGKRNARLGETLLTVQNLTRPGWYRNVSFRLKEGEILGLAGLRGSGRTEILKGIAGVDPAEKGTVSLGGFKGRFASPSQSLKFGIVYLPEDREQEGLISTHCVRENLILNALGRVSRAGFIDTGRERELINGLIDDFDIKVASPEQEVNQLSGGNKQKVVVGRISSAEPKVFLLDEPTRGVDISAKEGILRIIKEKLNDKAGIIITSPGVEDLIRVCDRILILDQGEITGEYKKESFSEREIYTAMQGRHLSKPAEGNATLRLSQIS